MNRDNTSVAAIVNPAALSLENALAPPLAPRRDQRREGDRSQHRSNVGVMAGATRKVSRVVAAFRESKRRSVAFPVDGPMTTAELFLPHLPVLLRGCQPSIRTRSAGGPSPFARLAQARPNSSRLLSNSL